MIGILTGKIVIQTRLTTRTASGATNTTWTNSRVIRARMSQNTPARDVGGVYQKVMSDVIFYVPAGSEVTENDRIEFEGQYYDILNIKSARGFCMGEHHKEILATVSKIK